MTTTEKAIAIAKLDGWEETREWNVMIKRDNGMIRCEAHIGSAKIQKYTHSLDAIVPVIRKQPRAVALNFMQELGSITAGHLIEGMTEFGLMSAWALVTATPAQLCEALLRATGKWKE